MLFIEKDGKLANALILQFGTSVTIIAPLPIYLFPTSSIISCILESIVKTTPLVCKYALLSICFLSEFNIRPNASTLYFTDICDPVSFKKSLYAFSIPITPLLSLSK